MGQWTDPADPVRCRAGAGLRTDGPTHSAVPKPCNQWTDAADAVRCRAGAGLGTNGPTLQRRCAGTNGPTLQCGRTVQGLDRDGRAGAGLGTNGSTLLKKLDVVLELGWGPRDRPCSADEPFKASTECRAGAGLGTDGPTLLKPFDVELELGWGPRDRPCSAADIQSLDRVSSWSCVRDQWTDPAEAVQGLDRVST